EPVQRNDSLVADGGVDDRVEVDERVMAGRILISDPRDLRLISGVRVRMTAGLGVGRRVSPFLPVALPSQALGRELIRKGLNASRVYAPLPDSLLRRNGAGTDEIAVELAVGLRLGVRPLPADLGDVVAEARMGRPVVLRQKVPARSQHRVQ